MDFQGQYRAYYSIEIACVQCVYIAFQESIAPWEGINTIIEHANMDTRKLLFYNNFLNVFSWTFLSPRFSPQKKTDAWSIVVLMYQTWVAYDVTVRFSLW